VTLANAHALFCGLSNTPSFLSSLNISDIDRAKLLAARNKIRSILKASADTLLKDDTFWQESSKFRTYRHSRPTRVTLKFMTQGSFSYGTLNIPAQSPKQEIDLDDGMYVPVDFLENGEPALAAKGLFSFVTNSLSDACSQNGWTVKEKRSCVRVQLWQGAHIDIPIYSIPTEKFAALRAAMDSANFAEANISRAYLSNDMRIPSDKIMLAQSDGSWLRSDPQELEEWVKARKDRLGTCYTRLCRFFKAWRDFNWLSSPLSSLCIMRAVEIALEELPGFPSQNRDDELVMLVAEKLPLILGKTVQNPVLRDLSLNEWEEKDREAIISASEELYAEMHSALMQTGDATKVVNKLRVRFGDRIPNRPDVVKIGSKIEAIQKEKPATVAAPAIVASTSG